MKTQNEYTPKLEMDRTTVDGLISCQSKFMFSTMSNRNFRFVRSLLIYHCYNWYFLIYPFLVGRETAYFVQGKDLKNYDPLECKFSDFHFLKKYLSGCWMRRKPSHWHNNWQMQSLTRIFIFFEYVQQVMSIQFYVANKKIKIKIKKTEI